MPKLKFKRSPEEEAEHQARKARRKEKKRKRERAQSDRYHSPHGSSSKRAHKENADDDDVTRRKWASSDEEDEERASKAEREHVRRGSEDAAAEMEFRQKMFDAMGEDERLDGVETHFNDFVHIPDRWKRAATTTSETYLYDADDFLKLNPNTLDDDEYAEWIRLGMYRCV